MEPVNPKDVDATREMRLPFHVIPPIAKVWLAKALADGAYNPKKNYGVWNWRNYPIEEQVYTDAIERHLLAVQSGEWSAPDSGLPHLAHIMACCAILLDSESQGTVTRLPACTYDPVALEEMRKKPEWNL